jgi:hypothetical protein
LYPSDEERARRKQQLEQEDKADAALLFDILDQSAVAEAL